MSSQHSDNIRSRGRSVSVILFTSLPICSPLPSSQLQSPHLHDMKNNRYTSSVTDSVYFTHIHV